MANRLNYYFRQKVTEAELDLGFAYLEAADRALATDLGIGNVTQGLGVAQQVVANLTVKVAGPGAAYDTQGRRMPVSSDQNVNCALDFNNVSTAVATPGNEKWLALFVYFDRTLSDPRVDGNSATVYFQEAETAKFKVVQGAEAAIGVATRPGLLVDHVLLADIRLINGQTQIVNGDISTTRRQVFFDLPGTPFSIKEAQFTPALAAMLGLLNTHITTGGPGVHQATSVSYAGGAAWADGTTNPAADVEVQLDKIVTDLALTTGVGGSARMGNAVLAGFAGAPYGFSAGTTRAALTTLLTGLNNEFRIRTFQNGGTTAVDAGGVRDKLVLLNRNAGSLAVQLPDPAANAGRAIVFLDKNGGISNATPVTVVRFGGELIQGLAATYTLQGTWGRWFFISDGTDWYVISV